jgi:hypothetical protein
MMRSVEFGLSCGFTRQDNIMDSLDVIRQDLNKQGLADSVEILRICQQTRSQQVSEPADSYKRQRKISRKYHPHSAMLSSMGNACLATNCKRTGN